MIPRTSDTVDICAHIYMKIEGLAPTSVATVGGIWVLISSWHLPNFRTFYNESMHSEMKVNVTEKKKGIDFPNMLSMPLTQGCWNGCYSR